jgi:LPS O-antigen subunit length determinant protein (WzzB/FepE family)
MNSDSSLNNVAADDEISLLDLALTVAENLRLLIIGPIAAGLIALGVSSLLPKTFESVAILNVIDQPEKVASLATSATVLDPVAEQLGLTKSATKDAARAELRERVSMAVGRKDGLLTLTTKGESGEEAQALANMVLAQLFVAVAPKGQDAADLEKSLSLARALYANNQLVIERSSALMGAAKSENAVNAVNAGLQGYAELIALQQSLAAKISSDERSLRGLTESRLAQTPTLPAQHVAPKRSLISVLTALATGFALLLFVFIRKAVANATVGEDGERVRQIKDYLLGVVGIRK